MTMDKWIQIVNQYSQVPIKRVGPNKRVGWKIEPNERVG